GKDVIGFISMQTVDPIRENAANVSTKQVKTAFKNVIAIAAYWKAHAVVNQSLPTSEHGGERLDHQIAQTVFAVQVVIANERVATPIQEKRVRNDRAVD